MLVIWGACRYRTAWIVAASLGFESWGWPKVMGRTSWYKCCGRRREVDDMMCDGGRNEGGKGSSVGASEAGMEGEKWGSV